MTLLVLGSKWNNKWYFPSISLASSRVNSGAIPKLSNTCPLWWYQHFVLHHHWHCQVLNLWPIIMERLTPQHSQLQGLDKIMGFSHPLHCPLCPCRVLTHYHNQQPVSPWLSSVSWINDVTVTQGVELSYKCNNKWYFPSTSLAASRVNSGAIPKLSNTCPLWWYQHFVLHHLYESSTPCVTVTS